MSNQAVVTPPVSAALAIRQRWDLACGGTRALEVRVPQSYAEALAREARARRHEEDGWLALQCHLRILDDAANLAFDNPEAPCPAEFLDCPPLVDGFAFGLAQRRAVDEAPADCDAPDDVHWEDELDDDGPPEIDVDREPFVDESDQDVEPYYID